MIFRSWVWFKPPQPPTAIDNRAMIIKIFIFVTGEVKYRTDSGASFCHVSKISPDDNGMP